MDTLANQGIIVRGYQQEVKHMTMTFIDPKDFAHEHGLTAKLYVPHGGKSDPPPADGVDEPPR